MRAIDTSLCYCIERLTQDELPSEEYELRRKKVESFSTRSTGAELLVEERDIECS
jgi:hypothetical protein